MSLLKRYRKEGGFEQLRDLLENSIPKKVDNLLKLIGEEDKAWATLLQAKMLSVAKIFTWPAEAVAEITTRVPIRTLAIALHGLSKEAFEKASFTMSNIHQRELNDLMEASAPSEGEINAAHIKLIQEARKLDRDGTISLERFDSNLAVHSHEIAS